jgi:hypothetical protein
VAGAAGEGALAAASGVIIPTKSLAESFESLSISPNDSSIFATTAPLSL